MVVIGVDVGAGKKGFHAVALLERKVLAKQTSTSAPEIAAWCRSRAAQVIGIDAPCKWRALDGRARVAELAMAADGITCYYTPTEEKAQTHAFYGWMLSGQELYSALSHDYPLFVGNHCIKRAMIETFPHAVACALSGRVILAKGKASKRRDLLRQIGFSVADLSNIDEIDATLCAIAARSFAEKNFKTYGDPAGGFIVVPNYSPRAKSLYL